MLGVDAVGCRAAGVSLAGGYQISQVLVKVVDVPISLVADVGINLCSWGISNVAAIREESSVGGGDELVSMSDDLCMECITVIITKLLHIWFIR